MPLIRRRSSDYNVCSARRSLASVPFDFLFASHKVLQMLKPAGGFFLLQVRDLESLIYGAVTQQKQVDSTERGRISVRRSVLNSTRKKTGKQKQAR